MMHSIRQFEVIRALARHRHFGRAAAELGVSQPALTRSLQHMEDDLGVKLFDRDGAVAPTVFGQILITCGDRLMSSFSDAMREIALLKGLDFGELTIAAGPYPTAIAIQHAVGELVTRHPRLAIQLRVKNWPDVMADVMSGAADVGVAFATGADVATEAADINLVGSTPHLVADAVDLARASVRLIRQNLAWAFGYNVVAIPLAALGRLPPAWAAAMMMVSSLTVVVNGLRLNRWKSRAM